MNAPRRVLASCFATLVVGASASLLVVTPAVAAPTWLSPAKLSGAGESAEAPQVSVDAQGDALAAWQRYSEKSFTNVIEVSGRPAGGGSWQAPVTVSDSEDEASLPQVALDSSGDAVAVWESFNGAEYSIVAATRTGLTGSWQAPVTLDLLGLTAEPAPDLAVDPEGDAVAIWSRTQASEGIVEAASKPAGSGAWRTAETLSKSAEVMHPAEVGLDAHGDATAVWEQKVGGEVLIGAASKPASGKWQAPIAISAEGSNANEPRVAVDAQGDAVAVWERPNGEEIIEAASRPASTGTWAKPVALTQPEGGKGEPANQQVAIDGQGQAVATWTRTNASSHDIVEASEGQVSSSTWHVPVSLSAPGANVEEAPQLRVNAQGNAVVVWERSNGTNDIVEAASGLASSGSWQTPEPLSSAGQEAGEQQVALDAQGNAVAVWSRFDGKASYIAEAAGYDAAGPLLNALTIPTAGTVGQSLAFSASPFDAWSALGATSWSFGDGTTQTGTSVTHAFGTAGTYTVTVTSADVLGNANTESGAVQIAAPATSVKPPVLAPVAPKITGARLTAKRFRVSAHPTAISAKAKAPRGTSFHFTLSEAAKLKIVFQRSAAGLRRGGRCLAPSAKLRRAHAKRCTRTLTAGTLTRAVEPAGPDNLSFSGRIGTRALAPGSYKAVLTAGASGLSSIPVTLSLAVVG